MSLHEIVEVHHLKRGVVEACLSVLRRDQRHGVMVRPRLTQPAVHEGGNGVVLDTGPVGVRFAHAQHVAVERARGLEVGHEQGDVADARD